jgi:glycosyltransferase involved in cell wall biosynthesis
MSERSEARTRLATNDSSVTFNNGSAPVSNGSGPASAPSRQSSSAVSSPVGVGAEIARMPAPVKHVARKRRRPTVSVVIPAKNEARNLALVLEELPKCVDEVILVDGRSRDSTRVMAVSCRPDVRIISDPEVGKGNALRAGFEAAFGDIIVALDADGSMSPREIPTYIYFLENGFDFVKGSRFIGGGGSLDITRMRRLGNRSLLALANRMFSVQLTDLCYGFFAFRSQYLDNLGLSSTGFEIETELVVRAVKAGLRIAEVPSIEMPRRSGRSNLRSIPDGYRVLQILLREWRGEPGRDGDLGGEVSIPG